MANDISSMIDFLFSAESRGGKLKICLVFLKKSLREKLLVEYKKKKEMAFKMSAADRRRSDLLEKEAAEILVKIDKLEV